MQVSEYRSQKGEVSMKPIVTKKPTLIIEEPVKVGTRLEISCNDGRVYVLGELAEVIGVSPSTIYKRLRQHPWDSPRILASALHQRDTIKKRVATAKRNKRKNESVFSHLGYRPRPEHLDRIPGPTSFDRMCM